MAEVKASSSSPDDRQKATRKRASRSNELGSPECGLNNGVPCGACKFLRRRCVDGCIFAPHFSSDQGTALFAAVHKVFGASNVSKLLMHLPVDHQHYAVQTISYEAQARLSDPVYGCVSTIIALQRQIATLKMELATVQNKLINNRLMVATALQGSLQQPEPAHQHQLQPIYSSGPSASNNSMINMDIFDVSLDNFASDHQTAIQSQESQPSFDPQIFQPFCKNDDYNEEESEDLLAFADELLQSR